MKIFEKQKKNWKKSKISKKKIKISEKTGSAHQKISNFRGNSNEKTEKHQKIRSGQPDGVAGLENVFLNKTRRKKIGKNREKKNKKNRLRKFD
jgi:hypothetical protein